MPNKISNKSPLFLQVWGNQKLNMLETERLLIKPLNYDQLIKYMAANNSLEEELGLRNSSRTISPELKEALEETFLPNVADKTKNYLYSTLWTLVSKKDNIMVGDICFCGEPDEGGNIEIGYGTYEEFRGQGYMIEGVGGIISWAKGQAEIKNIVASTDETNIASSRILQRNNFEENGSSDSKHHWILSLGKF